MPRNKRSRKKSENAGPSTSSKALEEHDLAYYVDDRVALMREVFTVLKPKEIKNIAPECVRKLSMDNLEELCLEELLGISSKRLCAVLDGAEPPSDTDTSSSSSSEKPVVREVIDLDSTSDDSSRKGKKKKHRKKKHKKNKKRKSNDSDGTGPSCTVTSQTINRGAQNRNINAAPSCSNEAEPAGSLAVAANNVIQDRQNRPPENAGMSILELLELQARARALKSQLHAEQEKNKRATLVQEQTAPSSTVIDYDDVEIKEEEEPEVVVISDSDNEQKPDIKVFDTPKVQDEAAKVSEASDVQVETAEVSGTSKVKEKTAKVTEAVTTTKTTDNVPETTRTKENSPEPSPPIAKQTDTTKDPETSQTNETNDFIITIPHISTITTRKIQLDRNNVVVSVSNVSEIVSDTFKETNTRSKRSVVEEIKSKRLNSAVTKVVKVRKESLKSVVKKRNNSREKPKKKRNEKDNASKSSSDKGEKQVEKEIDRDEITLELSDSEKMDLLEDLEQKNLSKVLSDSDEQSSSDESSSESDSDDENNKEISRAGDDNVDCATETSDKCLEIESSAKVSKAINVVVNEKEKEANKIQDEVVSIANNIEVTASNETKELQSNSQERPANDTEVAQNNNQGNNNVQIKENQKRLNKNINISEDKTIEVSCIDDIPVLMDYKETVEADKSDNDVIISSEETGNSTIELIVEEYPPIVSKEPTVEEIEALSAQMELLEQQNELTKTAMYEKSNVECTKETCDSNTNTDVSEKADLESNAIEKICDCPEKTTKESASNKKVAKDLSEGEISSSDIEVQDLIPEIVSLSDDDGTPKETSVKKKKKKHKKQKKSKKSKKKDFSESADENFYEETCNIKEKVETIAIASTKQVAEEIITVSIDTDDDVYEILEISDDSSCYEVEGTVLSKEPTTEEIIALSEKIDNINEQENTAQLDLSKDEEVTENVETTSKEDNIEEVENISWKDRYLDSKKVKRVLTTANILNALRKKNKELKRKMLEAKNKEIEAAEIEKKKLNEEEAEPVREIEEGTLEHYNTLQGSTKYVDPVKEVTEINTGDTNKVNDDENEKVTDNEKLIESQSTDKTNEPSVTKEMKREAKQLFKMYKRLLKYNDMNKQKDKTKKKKKKKRVGENKE